MSESDVTALLASAVKAVNASGADGELREEAFRVAVALLSGGSVTSANVTPVAHSLDPASTPTGPGNNGQEAPDSDDPLDLVARFTGCDSDVLHRVFAVQDGVPELKVPTKTLPSKKSQATADIALLVMAARQGAGVDDYTESETIRDATKAYSKFDSNNNASYLKPLDHFVLKQGAGVKTKRKLTKPGIEAAAEKIVAYATSAASV